MSQDYSRPFSPQPTSTYLQPTMFLGQSALYDYIVPAQTTHLYHLGTSPVTCTGCSLIFNVSVRQTANVTWGEMGVFSGFFPLTLTANMSITSSTEQFPTLTKLGIANIATVVGTTGPKVVDCAFTACTCYAGDELWVAMGFSAATVPTIYSNTQDFLESGRYLTVSGRPSTLTGAGPSNLTWGPTAAFTSNIAIMLNNG